MKFKFLKNALNICLIIVICICFSFLKIGVIRASFFSRNSVLNNEINLGDWIKPQIEILECPENSLLTDRLELKIKGFDSHSFIRTFNAILFSGTENSQESDWVKKREFTCLDGECNDLEEIALINFNLDSIENPNHKLCSVDQDWCQDKPLPVGNYYLMVQVFDNSKTLSEGGNISEDFIFNFEKFNTELPPLPVVNLICNLTDIKIQAGESIQFPNVMCENGNPNTIFKWDLNIEDGINLIAPDLVGNAPFLERGILLPGTYQAVLEAEIPRIIKKQKGFILDISNPKLSLNDLIINEFIPNPIGEDSALVPDGEWIELYNNLNVGIDLLGFVFYDAINNHDLVITRENVEDSSTLIQPKSYKIIYRNGDVNFSLNNSGLEKIRLFDGFLENNPLTLSQIEYSKITTEGKSLSRIPNLTGDFTEAETTKGMEN